jgi:hypothetical protein
MNGIEPDEAHQEHTRESSPYEPVVETPASPENLNAGSDYGEGSRDASRSVNPLRREYSVTVVKSPST